MSTVWSFPYHSCAAYLWLLLPSPVVGHIGRHSELIRNGRDSARTAAIAADSTVSFLDVDVADHRGVTHQVADHGHRDDHAGTGATHRGARAPPESSPSAHHPADYQRIKRSVLEKEAESAFIAKVALASSSAKPKGQPSSVGEVEQRTEHADLPPGCYDGTKRKVEGCRCHASCRSCGFNPKPVKDTDCLSCVEGMVLQVVRLTRRRTDTFPVLFNEKDSTPFHEGHSSKTKGHKQHDLNVVSPTYC